RLQPVFVDIDERTHNTNPQLVKKLISKKTRLMILTHMWGQPCDMDAFIALKNGYNLKIIEDCAMATGATYKGQKVEASPMPVSSALEKPRRFARLEEGCCVSMIQK
ncbi:MAG: DegT/DnrJ/EryC1/StrS family aminotransferase, partial [Candidatus Omnitrophota bacterium]